MLMGNDVGTRNPLVPTCNASVDSLAVQWKALGRKLSPVFLYGIETRSAKYAGWGSISTRQTSRKTNMWDAPCLAAFARHGYSSIGNAYRGANGTPAGCWGWDDRPHRGLAQPFIGSQPRGCPTLPAFFAGGWALATSTTPICSRLRAVHGDSISTIPSIPVA